MEEIINNEVVEQVTNEVTTTDSTVKEIPTAAVVGTLVLAGYGLFDLGRRAFNWVKGKIAKAKEKKQKGDIIDVKASEVEAAMKDVDFGPEV